MEKKVRHEKKNKSEGVQTSDAFWRSARVLVSELSFKWYNFIFLVLFCSILVEISDFSEIQLVCDGGTDGRTYPLIEMRERIKKGKQESGRSPRADRNKRGAYYLGKKYTSTWDISSFVAKIVSVTTG